MGNLMSPCYMLLLLFIHNLLFQSVIDSNIEMLHGININKIDTCILKHWAGSLLSSA